MCYFEDLKFIDIFSLSLLNKNFCSTAGVLVIATSIKGAVWWFWALGLNLKYLSIQCPGLPIWYHSRHYLFIIDVNGFSWWRGFCVTSSPRQCWILLWWVEFWCRWGWVQQWYEFIRMAGRMDWVVMWKAQSLCCFYNLFDQKGRSGFLLF